MIRTLLISLLCISLFTGCASGGFKPNPVVAVGVLDLLDHNNSELNRQTFQLIKILREVVEEDDEIEWLDLKSHLSKSLRGHREATNARAILATASSTLTKRVRDEMLRGGIDLEEKVRVGDILDTAEWILDKRNPEPPEIIIDDEDYTSR